MRFFSKTAALSIAGMALIAAALLYAEGAFERRPWGAEHFPNVVLTNQYGKKVRLYDDLIKGKAVAFNTFSPAAAMSARLARQKCSNCKSSWAIGLAGTSFSTPSASTRSTTRPSR